MTESNNSYRIRTNVGDKPNVLNVNLKQTFDTFEILSLKLDQTNAYKLYKSTYGIIVGRVLANGGFGIPNAKVSVFIELQDGASIEEVIKYPYRNVTDTNMDLVRYNLLPDFVDNNCYQNVGTFPNKRLLLDNNDLIEVFDKYWKYTTVTNQSGDYMLFGIPTGNQTVHVDIDLSDIGALSQRPRDMIYKGYNPNQFESPNKFKQSNNLDSLSQIYSQNIGVNVFPFWGDTTDGGEDIAITRCDIQIQYQFEPTCIFMGSIVTDTGSNAIGKNCAGTTNVGKMSDLVTGEGSIEMIRKTIDGRVEEYSIKGNRLIDGDGVWCYQIPMNLDYVKTDEFGNIVPTDDPSKGIPTRTRVRFRISLDDAISDNTARKRCKYLVPNNPRMTDDYPVFNDTKYVNYEFGTSTREEDYRDMFWNKVYTVKNYIPRLQKNNSVTNRKHTGIKMTNHYGDNNPIPYNSLTMKLSFTYRLICVITKIVIYIITFVNIMISILGAIPCWLAGFCLKIFKWKICPFKFVKKFIPKCLKLSSEFCDDGVNKNTYYPGCTGCVWDLTKDDHLKGQRGKSPEDMSMPTNSDDYLMTCVENSLVQENEASSFNFYNDWLNGVLYAPMWYRKITPKKSFFFGLFKKKAKDQWCSSNLLFGGLRLFFQCAVKKTQNHIVNKQCGNDCHKQTRKIDIEKGVIVPKKTMLGQTVYYYKSVEYSDIDKDVILLFATDIVLLGSLNECDLNGVPQFFKSLEPSTFNLPSDILFTDNELKLVEQSNGEITQELTSDVEMTGCDWGNINSAQECGKAKDGDSGLFYGVGCSTIEVKEKSCVNLTRICEFGVSLDEAKSIPDLDSLEGTDEAYGLLIPDGFISYDELYNHNERSMFATMNGNNLKVKMNETNGLLEYDFRYMYINNFDGSMSVLMADRQRTCDKTYRNNYKLETKSDDYVRFRMGLKENTGKEAYFYDIDRTMPRYENSFYFYFGLKSGKTAIEKFNSQFFSTCDNLPKQSFMTGIVYNANSWCLDKDKDKRDGYITFDLTNINTPYKMEIVNNQDVSVYVLRELMYEKVYIGIKDNVKGEIHQKRLIGYEPILIQEDGKNMTLENGTWKFLITDSNGNTAEIILDYIDELLNYKIELEHFKQPNNVLFSDFNSYRDICNDKDGFQRKEDNSSEDEQFWTRSIGGMIMIYGLFYRQEEMTNDYRITVEAVNIDNFNDYDTPYVKTIIENGILRSGYGLLLNDGEFKDTRVFCIGVPKGNEYYKVTVMGLCNGNESNNVVSRTVYIEEPIPFEMFINDVNYNLIKDFKTGWNSNVTSADIKTLYGWNDISNIGGLKILNENSVNLKEEIIKTVNILNINNIHNNNSPYNWTEEYCYKKDMTYDILMNDFDNEENKMLKTTVVEILNAVIQKRIDLVAQVKTGFYLTCPTDGKTLQVSARTNDFPVENYTKYIEEVETEGVENRNFISKCDIVDGRDVMSIDGIKIPTITYIENEFYGQNNVNYSDSNTGLCYGYDSTVRCYKKPYYVAIRNASGKTLPQDLGSDGFENGNITKMFGVHLFDKTMRLLYSAWTYIDDVPYFWPGGYRNEDERDGVSITMDGFLGGYMYNGISTETTEVYAVFDTQTYNNKKIIIKTLSLRADGTPNEDAIPTKRLIIGLDEDYENRQYKKYVLDEVTQGNESFYLPVPKKVVNLIIEDSSCSIEERINGNMTLRLTNDSINDSRNGNRVLNLVCNESGYDMRYYIVRWDKNNDNYLYNKIKFTVDGNGNKVFYFDANSYNDYYYMKHSFRHDDFYNIADENSKSQIIDEETNEPIEVRRYGTTGKFYGLTNDSYFVIATTDNNCCTLSPVYDFSEIKVKVMLTEYESENSEGIMETFYGIKYGVHMGEEFYYLKNYNFDVEFKLKFSDIDITTSFTNKKITEKIEKSDEIPPLNGDPNTLYCKQEGGVYKVYEYTGQWIVSEVTETAPTGMTEFIPDNESGIYYVKNDEAKEGVIQYAVIDVNNGTIVIDYSDEVYEENPTILDWDYKTSYFYKTVEQVDDGSGTGTTIEKTMYNIISCAWVFTETTMYDPTVPHYNRMFVYTVTKEQNKELREALLMYKNFGIKTIVKATTCQIVDYSGLRHNCIIEY